MRKEALLSLLLRDELETVGAWAAALGRGDRHSTAADAVASDEEEEGGRAPLITAIDEVVPYLPDYSAVSTELKALMSYAEEAYSNQVNRLVQGWLQRPHSVHFRRWVLRDWLKCSHLTSAEPAALVQWRLALFVAATDETVKPLKRTLLECLSAVNEAVEARFQEDEDGDVASKTPSAALQSLETVEALLDFCFLHAEQLASCSLLCAAKLHALARRTQRSAVKLAEDDGVLVRVRWSLMLKPVLFKPLLRHAIALKTVSGNMTAGQLWTSDELAGLVGLADADGQVTMLEELSASRLALERAFTFGAEHIHSSASGTRGRSVVEAAAGKYVEALPAEKRASLFAELERDLDEAPPHLFPHIFVFFKLILSPMLSSSSRENQGLIVKAVNILIALFHRRSHDAESCLDALGLLLRQSLAASPIWSNNPPFYVQAIESLSEAATLQVEPTLKWAARMALYQLLFECDVQLLHRYRSNLSKLLPPRTTRLVSIRLGN
ncbi:hypothetical protein PHYPSEUDO_009761 [Phytophthora pseudosyringae]|uniref:Uncharacterized protein n=1 Tax=Phytophthora pseudosyringae TaxID=221518 RepID=A0A8T1VBP3_9STRA|nr:hypothetical protein PHYPSEUDO_009761 [Phytophthora pseudosyringae]